MKPFVALFAICFSCLGSYSAEKKETASAPWLEKDHVEKESARITELAGTRPAQWRVIWKEDPATRATLSWSTAKKGNGHLVRYDVKSRAGNADAYAFQRASDRDGPYADADGEHFHHVRLTNLKPSTTYWFVLESDGARSPELRFTTAPADDRPFAVLFGGDSRSGHFARAQVNLLMAALAEEDDALLAFAHGGDYVSSGRSWSQWSRWLSQHELATTAAGKVLPIVPARGNHDGGPLYDQIFDSPGSPDRENYFLTRLSPKTSLLTLNTETNAGGAQRTWLGKTLRAERPRVRWLLSQYHRPAWPAVKSPGSAQKFWTPLFEEFNLDLAVESDGHVLKRTVPIRNGKADETGVPYVGEGGLGVGQRRPDAGRWYLRPPGMTGRGHHVMRIRFTPEKMDYEAIFLDRSVPDRRTFRPRRK